MKIQNIKNTELTPQYFIDFYSKIPDDKWCTGNMKIIDLENLTHKCCSLGHLGMKTFTDVFINEKAKVLQSFFNEDKSGRPSCVAVVKINDDIDNRYYPGKTPKERIINALKSLL